MTQAPCHRFASREDVALHLDEHGWRDVDTRAGAPRSLLRLSDGRFFQATGDLLVIHRELHAMPSGDDHAGPPR